MVHYIINIIVCEPSSFNRTKDFFLNRTNNFLNLTNEFLNYSNNFKKIVQAIYINFFFLPINLKWHNYMYVMPLSCIHLYAISCFRYRIQQLVFMEKDTLWYIKPTWSMRRRLSLPKASLNVPRVFFKWNLLRHNTYKICVCLQTKTIWLKQLKNLQMYNIY